MFVDLARINCNPQFWIWGKYEGSMCLNPLTFQYLMFCLCYGHIRDSPRSWCEQGFLKIQVTGIRCYWLHLWCSPSAGCSQSAGRLYKRDAVSSAQLVVCFQRVNTISWLSSFSVFLPDQWLPLHLSFFGSFLSFAYLIESVGGYGFYSHHDFLDTKGPVCFDLFCNLCSALFFWIHKKDICTKYHTHFTLKS